MAANLAGQKVESLAGYLADMMVESLAVLMADLMVVKKVEKKVGLMAEL